MSNRYAPIHPLSQNSSIRKSTLLIQRPSFGHNNNARDDLFSTYNRSASPSKNKSKPAPQSYSPYGGNYNAPAASAYPGASNLYPSYGAGGSGDGIGGMGVRDGGMRSATPNSRGQYSAAVLDELESQNDDAHVGVLTGKVKQLKDVRPDYPYLSPISVFANARPSVDAPHRRRDPRLNRFRGEDERPV